ncbi:hypothetical protein HB779_09905 [Phyllobacterium sp. 628]|uniref:hypothetical protein n=1 Tax=Phyllobacterium sp. 628 TaxID=2718938 RepID=UPI00166279C2|nr:hypothetical protein [Phyllobacterium sp. 628]QND52188.1 hypothetical protein HB779_09905 [Phyllobacterium sp. 628]
MAEMVDTGAGNALQGTDKSGNSSGFDGNHHPDDGLGDDVPCGSDGMTCTVSSLQNSPIL